MNTDRQFRGRTFALALAGAAVVLAGVANSTAWAIEEDGAPSNVYMTGAEVRIERAVEGDLTVAAGRLHVDQPVGGDALLGGGSIDVQAPVGEDLRAAGGIVTLASTVHGTALVAAGRVIVTSAAEMHGETWLAAGSVTLGGRALSAVKVYAREVNLLGEIYGPVSISSDRIEIRDGAQIYGDLSYTGANEIVVKPGARVTGRITRVPGNLESGNSAANIPGLKPLRPLFIAALFAAGVLLHALFPGFTGAAVRTLGAVPAKSLGLGTALFFSVPPIAVLLVITIIGIPLGVALVAAYALALLVGYLVAAYFFAAKLGQAVRQRTPGGWTRYAFFAGALVLLALATSIPYAGPLVLLLAAAAGLGAVVLQRFSRHTHSTRSDPRTEDTWPAA